MNCATADALIKYALKTISSTMNNANATVLSLLELQHVVPMNSGLLRHANVCADLTQNVAILTQNFGQLIYADAHASLLLPVRTNITPGISNLANVVAAHQAFAVLNNTSTLLTAVVKRTPKIVLKDISGTLMPRDMEDANKTQRLVKTTITGTSLLMSAFVIILLAFVKMDFSGTPMLASASAKVKTVDQDNTGSLIMIIKTTAHANLLQKSAAWIIITM